MARHDFLWLHYSVWPNIQIYFVRPTITDAKKDRVGENNSERVRKKMWL